MRVSRRQLIWSALGGGAALVVGWSGLPPRSRLGAPDVMPDHEGEVGLNGWIKIRADGHAVLAMPWAEMGQGVHTAMALVVAEELDLPLAKVHLTEAPHERIYGNVAAFAASLPVHPRHAEPGHETLGVRLSLWLTRKLARELGLVITGGSSTIADGWPVLRLAAATARAQLLGVASLRWKLPVDEFEVLDGVVRHAGSGQQLHYGELAAEAVGMPPGTVRLKPRSQWRQLGQATQRSDAPAKSRGEARYGIDVRQPQQLFAVVRHAPMRGGLAGTVRNADAVRQMPGVQQLVTLEPLAGSTGAVAVVAISSWHALQATRALDVDWQARPEGALDSDAVMQALTQAAQQAAEKDEGFSFHAAGDARAALGAAKTVHQAVYSAPYLAHATMEPMNATARVADGQVEVWAPTQVPGLARAAAARVAGVDEEQVTLHMTLMGGGFGRRLEVDSVAQAVRVAQAMGGRPVQLLWPREEDFAHDFYRPAGVAVLRGSLDSRGRLHALSIHSAGDALTPRWMARNVPWLSGPVDVPDKVTAEGLYDLPYAVPNQRMRHVATHSGVPVGNWRSVGHSHNAFFSESFVDEMAHAASADPLAFRLDLLADQPRHAAVLQRAAQVAGWGLPLPGGRARGLALHESFGSVVAMVLEVSLDGTRPRVHRVVCAVDCGTVINPDGVVQQVEGSVVFGLTAALDGDITLKEGVVQQTQFATQPLLTLRECPRIETVLVPSERAPSGMGEPAVPPVAPALANALFALTGQRLRTLPLRLR